MSDSGRRVAADGRRIPRMLTLWLACSIALGCIAALVLGYLAPLLSARSAVDAYCLGRAERAANPIPVGTSAPRDDAELEFRAIRELGGEERAASALHLYCRGPESVAPHKKEALWLLSHCGVHGIPALVQAAKYPDPFLRMEALRGLCRLGPEAANAAPAMIAALTDGEAAVRSIAATGIEELGLSPDDATPLLVKCIEDNLRGQHLGVVGSAVRSLSKIAVRSRSAEALLRSIADEQSQVAPHAREALRLLVKHRRMKPRQ